MSDSIDGLKQRLVGAFVIITLAIIFLPMIFDKPHVIGNSKIVPVPPRPDYQTVTVKQAEKPAFEVIKVEESAKVVREETKASISNAKPVAVAKAVPAKKDEAKAVKHHSAEPKPEKKARAISELPAFKDVWMVQLGTFSDSNNAYKLRDRLRKEGYGSHTKPVTIKGKRSIRVFSGPFVNKREAQKVKKKLDAKFRVNSLVLFFDA